MKAHSERKAKQFPKWTQMSIKIPGDKQCLLQYKKNWTYNQENLKTSDG